MPSYWPPEKPRQHQPDPVTQAWCPQVKAHNESQKADASRHCTEQPSRCQPAWKNDEPDPAGQTRRLDQKDRPHDPFQAQMKLGSHDGIDMKVLRLKLLFVPASAGDRLMRANL